MPHFGHMLASDDAVLFKIAFWVIIGVIWLVAKVVKGITGSGNAPQRVQSITTDDAPIDLTPAMEIRPSPSQLWQQMSPKPIMAAPPPLPGTGKRGKKARRPTEPVAAPAVQPRQAPPTSLRGPLVPLTAPRPTAPAPNASVSLDSLKQAIRPQALRRQFALIEILGKPLALRDNDQSAFQSPR